MAKNTNTKTRKPAQGDITAAWGNVRSFIVGESALEPGHGQIVQYGALLVGPLTPEQLRELAVHLNACADAIDGAP